jgi:hypothetical protein
MNRLTEKAIELMPGGLTCARDVVFLLGGTDDSRYGIVKRFLKGLCKELTAEQT